jgi:Fe-S cluster biosynthesis and repair protein YggX
MNILQSFLLESAISEFQKDYIDILSEDINQYLSTTLVILKNKKPEDAFKDSDPKAINVDHLAKVIVGVKVLGNQEHRSALTKTEIGFQASDNKELFKFLTDVARDGKDPTHVQKAFDFIAKLAPTAIKKQTIEIEKLKTGNDQERKQVIQDLEKFLHKVSQYYGKLRQSSNQTTKIDSDKLSSEFN